MNLSNNNIRLTAFDERKHAGSPRKPYIDRKTLLEILDYQNEGRNAATHP